MENRCYNCEKALSADRTCISDGECDQFVPVGHERKCRDCWYFAKDYFCHRDCCTVDEEDDEGTIHFAEADDDACGRWEQNLTYGEESVTKKSCHGSSQQGKRLLQMEVYWKEDEGKHIVHFLDPKHHTWEDSEITQEEAVQLMRMCYRGLVRK